MGGRGTRAARMALLFGLVTATGCGADEEAGPLRLELPVDASHRAVLIASQVDGDAASLIAADIVDGEIAPVMQPLMPEARVDVTALVYDAPLSSLALSEGTLELAAAGEADRALPAPIEIHATRVDSATGFAWSRLDRLPAAIEGLRLPAADPCARFLGQEVALGASATPTSVLALDEVWGLVMTEGPEVFFVDGARVVRQSVSAALHSGYRRADGAIWLGGEGGAIFSARFFVDPEPRLELTEEGTVSSRETVIDLVGAPDGPIEHFALTSNRDEDEQWGAFEWFDGDRWTVPGLRRNTPHDATWVSRGFGLFASFFRDGEVFGARDGQETSIDVTSVVLGNVVVIEQVPGFGLVAGTTAADVHVDAGDGVWRRIPTSSSQRVGAVRGYQGGIVYLRGTSVAHYPAEGAACEDSGLLAPQRTSLDRMDVVGEHLLVPLVPVEGVQVDEHRVAWFERQR